MQTKNTLSAAILLAITLTACDSDSEAPAPEPIATSTPVVEAMTLPVAKPVPEPCYSAPTLAHAMKLAADPKIKALYDKSARQEVRIVHSEYCFIMNSGYANLGFDSEFSMNFRNSTLGKAIGIKAKEFGISDLELASAFYDIAA